MDEKSKLQAQISALRERLNAITDAEAEAECQSLIGRCFRYRNCYSCPSSDADYWWEYRRVAGTDGFSVSVHEFAIDRDGQFRMRSEKHVPRSMGGWEEISRADYRKALRSFRAKAERWMDQP